MTQNQDGSYTVDRESWITKALRDKIPCVRVLIYNHGKPREGDDLDSLATNLLEHVIAERKGDVRHIFFNQSRRLLTVNPRKADRYSSSATVQEDWWSKQP